MFEAELPRDLWAYDKYTVKKIQLKVWLCIESEGPLQTASRHAREKHERRQPTQFGRRPPKNPRPLAVIHKAANSRCL